MSTKWIGGTGDAPDVFELEPRWFSDIPSCRQACISARKSGSWCGLTWICFIELRNKSGRIFSSLSVRHCHMSSVCAVMRRKMVLLMHSWTPQQPDSWYTFCAPYSPDFKPVERLFAMVKTILRDREDEAALDPFNAIKAIFDSFRPGGPLAHHANNHFRMYSDNHNAWLNFWVD